MKLWLACAIVIAAQPLAAAQPRAEFSTDVVIAALALLGTPYRFGGAVPATGLDCSGLVRHVFKAARDMDLPRRSEDMSRVGQSIERGDLQPGDLLFFNTLQRVYSHVAIYIGGGQFVHAPADGGRVRTESLSGRYWQARYNGARRLDGGSVASVAPPRSAGFIEDPDIVRP
jgi:cell wall-associated NlpC family hydrolase